MWWGIHSGRPALKVSVLAMALCAVVACKQEQAGQDVATDDNPEASASRAAGPEPVVSGKVAAMGVEDLRKAATTALNEQRLYAPAGNNAMEYYVALRDKAPEDAAVASALTDLMPYALIATEQSIGRDDFSEAQRLYGLMEKADPRAPALPRLKQSMTDAQASLAQRAADAEARTVEEAQREAELARERAEQQQRAQQQAAQELAQQQPPAQAAPAPAAAAPAPAPAQPSGAEQQAAERRAAEQRAAEQRQAEQRAAAQREEEQRQAAQQAASQAAPAALRAVSTPAPDYPPAALRAGESGEVIVEFTVNPDGSVSNARVVRANPPRTFDRAALNAVRRWRFQPVASATTTRRTIGFQPGQ